MQKGPNGFAYAPHQLGIFIILAHLPVLTFYHSYQFPALSVLTFYHFPAPLQVLSFCQFYHFCTNFTMSAHLLILPFLPFESIPRPVCFNISPFPPLPVLPFYHFTNFIFSHTWRVTILPPVSICALMVLTFSPIFWPCRFYRASIFTDFADVARLAVLPFSIRANILPCLF